MSEIKTFVLDTNVLLHSAHSLEGFSDNRVVIPMTVIEELDKFKKNQDELGRNSRQVVRKLDSLRKTGNLSEGVRLDNGPGYRPYVKAFDKEIETLKKLKEAGYLLGVVTNKGAPLTKYSLEVCHIEDLFDVVISADDVNAPKPSPLGIDKALERLAIADKDKVLYIGDNDIDYETATNAGVDALLVTWGPRKIKRVRDAKYAASSYNELGGILL